MSEDNVFFISQKEEIEQGVGNLLTPFFTEDTKLYVQYSQSAKLEDSLISSPAVRIEIQNPGLEKPVAWIGLVPVQGHQLDIGPVVEVAKHYIADALLRLVFTERNWFG